MQLIVTHSYEDFSRKAADLLVESLNSISNPVVVLPTGNTPLGMYSQLLKRLPDEKEIFSKAHFVQLDEYAGIEKGDWRSLAGWLRKSFFEEANISMTAVSNFRSAAPDGEGEALRMEKLINDAGGIDISILGIGLNGHVGFNEPGSMINDPTRVIKLTPQSISSNAAYWGNEEDVPRQAYTLGLGTLSQAQQTILLVSGSDKAQIICKTMEGPVSPQVPASFIQQIKNVTVIADTEAAAALNQKSWTEQIN